MAQTTEHVASFPDVLTLAEAAAYLRVSEAEIVELMRRQGLPGRKIDDDPCCRNDRPMLAAAMDADRLGKRAGW
jgi:hypothetical protein